MDIPIVRENDRSVTILVSFQGVLSTLSFPFLFFFSFSFSFFFSLVRVLRSILLARACLPPEKILFCQKLPTMVDPLLPSSHAISTPLEVIRTVEKYFCYGRNRASRSPRHERKGSIDVRPLIFGPRILLFSTFLRSTIRPLPPRYSIPRFDIFQHLKFRRLITSIFDSTNLSNDPSER